MDMAYIIYQVFMLIFMLTVLTSLGFYIRMVSALVGWLKRQLNPALVGIVVTLVSLSMFAAIFFPQLAANIKLILFINSLIFLVANNQDEKIPIA